MKKQNQKPASNRVNFTSIDRQVQIVTKVGSARRFPQHAYPVVCMKLRPQKGTRIQQLPDGSGGLDVLLTHVEVAAFLKSLNRADKKANYRWEPVAEKPAARKARWDAINAQRLKGKQGR